MAKQSQPPVEAQASQPAAEGRPARQRILRIGVILGGKIVEERLVRGRDQVTLGQSAKNTVSVPLPELPRSWPLFVPRGNRYVLNLAEGMDGRLSDGARVHSVNQLKQSGQMRRQGTGWQIGLPEAARGKVTVGDLTLLFQFVTALPPAARPQLPPSVRGRLSDRIDPYMAIVLAASLLVNGAFGFYVYNMDVPAPLPPDQIPDRFAKMALDRPPEVQEKKKADVGVATNDAADANAKSDQKGGGKGDKKSDKKGDGDTKPKGAPDHAAVAQAVQGTAVVRVLGVYSSSGSGRFVDVNGGRDAGGDLDRGLSNVRSSGTGLATAGGGSGLGGGTRGPATGEIGTGKYTGTSGPSGPGTVGPAHEEREVKVDIKSGGFDAIDAGGLDPGKVMSTIKGRYFGSVRKCYEQELKGDPTLQGKITITFTVGPAGNVTKVNVDGFNSAVDACIESRARSWRFDKPEEGSAEFETSFILRPGS